LWAIAVVHRVAARADRRDRLVARRYNVGLADAIVAKGADSAHTREAVGRRKKPDPFFPGALVRALPGYA
jgi:hypothetical protein